MFRVTALGLAKKLGVLSCGVPRIGMIIFGGLHRCVRMMYVAFTAGEGFRAWGFMVKGFGV